MSDFYYVSYEWTGTIEAPPGLSETELQRRAREAVLDDIESSPPRPDEFIVDKMEY